MFRSAKSYYLMFKKYNLLLQLSSDTSGTFSGNVSDIVPKRKIWFEMKIIPSLHLVYVLLSGQAHS